MTSIVLSVVATVALNVVPRLFPRQTRSIGERIERRAAERVDRSPNGASEQPRVQVFFPWKAMLIGSVLLTVLLNVVPRLF